MAAETCDGCPYHERTDDGGFSYRMVYHHCYIEPTPILRKKADQRDGGYDAPIACGRKPKAEQQP